MRAAFAMSASSPVSGSFRTSRFAIDGVAPAAAGDTVVNRLCHLDHGFERVEDKLAACGAAIERISG